MFGRLLRLYIAIRNRMCYTNDRKEIAKEVITMFEFDKQFLFECFYASCRLSIKKKEKDGLTIGSATIVYSEIDPREPKKQNPVTKEYEDNYETLALTNAHVIEEAISIVKEWNSVLKREVQQELKSPVTVDLPQFDGDRIKGWRQILATILAYDKRQDIALIRFRDHIKYPASTICPPDMIENIRITAPIRCVGAALGNHPVVTDGFLCDFDIEIDNYDYWLGTHLSFFGNSGGGIFWHNGEKWCLIGIPSRITVVVLGWSANVVTHLGYFIPPTRLLSWLSDTCYNYIFDKSSPLEADKKRIEKQEETLRKLLQYKVEEI